ncbi:hypothetical protein HJ590_04580 [Naumannella sp. ID2617S]|nr:hypothetical protein [Naumannella sp. ID2617S]
MSTQPGSDWDGRPQWVRPDQLGGYQQGPPTAPPGPAPGPASAILPARWPTVVVTLFLGLCGMIPAALAGARAQELGHGAGRYWKAFGIAFVAQLLVLGLLVAALLGGIYRALIDLTGRGSGSGGVAVSSSAPVVPTAPAVSTTSSASQTTAASAASTSSAPTPSPTPSSSAVTSLPSGSWITVLDSLPKSQHAESEAGARANALRGSAAVQVVDSDRIAGLNAGYWALAVTGRSSRDQAAAVCGSFGRAVGGQCYPRQVG